MSHVYWSKEEVRALVEAIREGATTSELVDELKRSQRSIEYKRRVVGPKVVSGRRPDVDKRVRVLALLADGLSMRRIAARLGIQHSSVQRMCRLMVRDGLLRRVGDRTRQVRYVATVEEEMRTVTACHYEQPQLEEAA
jgi:predicted HTH transcriptional regulator